MLRLSGCCKVIEGITKNLCDDVQTVSDQLIRLQSLASPTLGVTTRKRHHPNDRLVMSRGAVVKMMPGLATHCPADWVSSDDVSGDKYGFTAFGTVGS